MTAAGSVLGWLILLGLAGVWSLAAWGLRGAERRDQTRLLVEHSRDMNLTAGLKHPDRRVRRATLARHNARPAQRYGPA